MSVRNTATATVLSCDTASCETQFTRRHLNGAPWRPVTLRLWARAFYGWNTAEDDNARNVEAVDYCRSCVAGAVEGAASAVRRAASTSRRSTLPASVHRA